ncbi:hypothetical protein F4802DRAFT_600040 [Xylaria palmicola]|nr:hypothetical protein F4802DRAFT_600040 [Xylaria palmicola]
MKWQLSLLSLAWLPAVLAAPVENPVARGAAVIEAREPGPAAEVASPEKRNDDEVELLWGSGKWSYGSSKRDEERPAPVKREAASEKDDEVELLWGSGKWSYGSSKRDEENTAPVKREAASAKDDEVELLWGSGRWSYGSSKRDNANAAQA